MIHHEEQELIRSLRQEIKDLEVTLLNRKERIDDLEEALRNVRLLNSLGKTLKIAFVCDEALDEN